jgi:hypothetical protein
MPLMRRVCGRGVRRAAKERAVGWLLHARLPLTSSSSVLFPFCYPCFFSIPSLWSVSTNDIVFVVMTSSKTPLKAKGVLDSWGSGLENILMISDAPDPELPPGTITPAGAAAQRAASASAAAAAGSGGGGSGGGSGAYGGSGAANSGGGGSGGSGGRVGGVGASIKQALDEQHTPIWGVKYLSASPDFARLKSKRWFVLADDDTWVNIPALLDFAARYDSRCPVVFGYVWSKIWSDHDLDYHSGGAGLLMSQEAFLQVSSSPHPTPCLQMLYLCCTAWRLIFAFAFFSCSLFLLRSDCACVLHHSVPVPPLQRHHIRPLRLGQAGPARAPPRLLL